VDRYPEDKTLLMKRTEVYPVEISPFFNDFFYLIQKLIEAVHTILKMLAIHA
jgi:hypothetical protein